MTTTDPTRSMRRLGVVAGCIVGFTVGATGLAAARDAALTFDDSPELSAAIQASASPDTTAVDTTVADDSPTTTVADDSPDTTLPNSDDDDSPNTNTTTITVADDSPDTTIPNSDDDSPNTTITVADDSPNTTITVADDSPTTTITVADDSPTTTVSDDSPTTPIADDSSDTTIPNSDDDSPNTTIPNSDDDSPNTTIPNSDDDSPTTTIPSTTVATLPAPFSETYVSAGGSIHVSWTGTAFALHSVDPAAGFSPEIEDQRWDKIRVDFDGDDHDSRIEVRLDDTGHVRVRID